MLRVASFRHSPDLKEVLESQLPGEIRIRSVSANIPSGNILVFIDPDRELNHILSMVEFVVRGADIASVSKNTTSAKHARAADPNRAG